MARRRPFAADAYSSDPQFYQFYQSLEAYKNTFNPGDVIVVDPSNDFFRFMRSPTGGAAPDAPRSAQTLITGSAAAKASRRLYSHGYSWLVTARDCVDADYRGDVSVRLSDAWRDTFREIAERPPHQIRIGGLIAMVLGLILLFIVT